MRHLQLPAVLAATLVAGTSCKKGTGPEIDATIERTDARGSSADASAPRDAGVDASGSDEGHGGNDERGSDDTASGPLPVPARPATSRGTHAA